MYRASSRYSSISKRGSTTAATPAVSSPIRYEAQPRSSWVSWRKITRDPCPRLSLRRWAKGPSRRSVKPGARVARAAPASIAAAHAAGSQEQRLTSCESSRHRRPRGQQLAGDGVAPARSVLPRKRCKEVTRCRADHLPARRKDGVSPSLRSHARCSRRHKPGNLPGCHRGTLPTATLGKHRAAKGDPPPCVLSSRDRSVTPRLCCGESAQPDASGAAVGSGAMWSMAATARSGS